MTLGKLPRPNCFAVASKRDTRPLPVKMRDRGPHAKPPPPHQASPPPSCNPTASEKQPPILTPPVKWASPKLSVETLADPPPIKLHGSPAEDILQRTASGNNALIAPPRGPPPPDSLVYATPIRAHRRPMSLLTQKSKTLDRHPSTMSSRPNGTSSAMERAKEDLRAPAAMEASYGGLEADT